MGFNKQLKLCLVVLAVVFALVAKSSAKIQDSVWFSNYGHKGDKGGDSLIDSAHSKVGDLIGDENEMMMDSETNRRTLAGRGKYIGYGALKRNAVPCGRRGVSYYNCQNRQEANPYKRSCTYITRCGRR